MTSSTVYKNKSARASKHPAFMPAIVLGSVAFSFGIGYKLGAMSVPVTTPRIQPTATSARPVTLASAPARNISGQMAHTQTPAVWTAIGSTKYTLYLASFQIFADAQKEKARLESKGVRGVEISEKRVAGPESQMWYRLRYGRFDTRDAAIAFGRQLTDRGLIRDFWPKELL